MRFSEKPTFRAQKWSTVGLFFEKPDCVFPNRMWALEMGQNRIFGQKSPTYNWFWKHKIVIFDQKCVKITLKIKVSKMPILWNSELKCLQTDPRRHLKRAFLKFFAKNPKVPKKPYRRPFFVKNTCFWKNRDFSQKMVYGRAFLSKVVR